MDNPQVAKYVQALKDHDEDVRWQAALALRLIGDAAAVPALIEALKDKDLYVREHAASALGKIGDAAAVPALIEALRDWDMRVQWHAAFALREIGIPAVPALIEAVKDQDGDVRCLATSALGKVGDAAAVPALIEALKDKDQDVRKEAASALGDIGDAETLTRKILAASQFSAQQKIKVLDTLRQVRGYRFPDTPALCQTVLNEDNAEARVGAQAVLNWLNGDGHLLHASHPNTTNQAQELLTAYDGGPPEARPDTLLRADDRPEKDVAPPPTRPTLRQRLFGKPDGAS